MKHILIEAFEDEETGEARYWGFDYDHKTGLHMGFKSKAVIRGQTVTYYVCSNQFKIKPNWARRIAVLFHERARKVCLDA